MYEYILERLKQRELLKHLLIQAASVVRCPVENISE